MRDKKEFIYIFLVFIFLGIFDASAQKINKDFYFVYIAHDRATPVQRLSKTLQEIYDGAIKYGHSCVFYLANNESPYIVNVNIGNDNRNDFDAIIIGELQNKLSHSISPRFDLDTIVNMFNGNDYLLSGQELKYTSVTWNFYTSEWFWSEGYNESLIAPLYWIMDIDKTEELDFYFNVYHSENDKLELDDKVLFGVKNLSNINEGFLLLEY